MNRTLEITEKKVNILPVHKDLISEIDKILKRYMESNH